MRASEAEYWGYTSDETDDGQCHDIRCINGDILVCPDDMCIHGGGCGRFSNPACYRPCPSCGLG